MLQHMVRALLQQDPDAALCDSCLAFACSTSVIEISAITASLLDEDGEFQLRSRCASCHRAIPATCYAVQRAEGRGSTPFANG
jgi:hypothetical protein